MNRIPILLLSGLTLAMGALSPSAQTTEQDTEEASRPTSEEITIFRSEPIGFRQNLPEPSPTDDPRVLQQGQVVERTVELPPAPTDQRDARRITAIVDVRPVLMRTRDERVRPGDPWTRLGTLGIVISRDEEGAADEIIELMRFITGFGGPGRFEQDVTALAPVLYGEQDIRVHIDTWFDPGWEVTVKLRYDTEDVGYRRPTFAEFVLHDQHIEAEDNRHSATITIPKGLNQPRLRIYSTGHSTDGREGNEFISSTHILRIDGKPIAMWRPWREDGSAFREHNPTSFRTEIDERELWSSDLDRSGWVPGDIVKPLIIPAPELDAGEHTIELEIIGIRPKTPNNPEHGFWRVSIAVVADEPWPEE